MRTIIVSFLLATAVFAGDTNAFLPYRMLLLTNSSEGIVITNGQGIRVHIQQPLLEPSKSASITNGITLGQVVTNLGPGWMWQTESVGIIQWSFNDGRELDVLPGSISAGEVLSSDKGSRSRFWFSTNEIYAPKR
jgi:hypothetical protein